MHSYDLFFHRFPLWVMITTSAAYVLTTLNCCVNFVVYFVMYSAFRKELKEQSILLKNKVKTNWSSFKEAYSSKQSLRSGQNSKAGLTNKKANTPDRAVLEMEPVLQEIQ